MSPNVFLFLFLFLNQFALFDLLLDMTLNVDLCHGGRQNLFVKKMKSVFNKSVQMFLHAFSSSACFPEPRCKYSFSVCHNFIFLFFRVIILFCKTKQNSLMKKN